MNRRAFLQAITAGLAVLGVVRPAVAKIDKYGPADGYTVRLWDGYRLIRQVHTQYAGREILVPVFARGGNVEHARFRYTNISPTHRELDAQYVDGPRFWKRGAA